MRFVDSCLVEAIFAFQGAEAAHAQKPLFTRFVDREPGLTTRTIHRHRLQTLTASQSVSKSHSEEQR